MPEMHAKWKSCCGTDHVREVYSNKLWEAS